MKKNLASEPNRAFMTENIVISDEIHLKIPRLLKIAEVAKVLQISQTSAYRLAASGELPSVRFSGATVRIRQEDLEKFIQSNLVGENPRGR